MRIQFCWLRSNLPAMCIVVLLAITFSGTVRSQPLVGDPLAAQELARAETLIELGAYDEAVDILKRLANSGFVLAAVRLADLLYDEIEIGSTISELPEQQQILDLAIEFYREATAIDGRHYDRAGRRLARLLLLRARTDEDVRTAVDRLRGLIVLGSGAAAYDLGRAYMFGRGVPGNAREAERYLHIAIDMEEYNAARLFGFILARGIGRPADPDAAIPYLQLAVDHDDYRAARTMADVYARSLDDIAQAVAAVDTETEILLRLYGDDPRSGYAMRLSEIYLRDPYRPQDVDQGIAWLERAALDDTGLAAFRLFQIYSDGQFGPHDPDLAQEFATGVAAASYWDAMPSIASHYFNQACDSPAVAIAALAWVELAAAAAHADSMYILSRALGGSWPCLTGSPREAQRWLLAAAEAGWGTNEDVLDMARIALEAAIDDEGRNDGLALLAVAAARGNLAARTDLGALLIQSEHAERDYQRGADLLRAVAVEENGARAMLTLARALLYSADPSEREEALAWLKRAAGYGRPDAMRILGRMHLEGMVTPYDPEAAIRVLSHSLAYGDGESGLMLADLFLAGIGGAVDLDRARAALEQAAQNGSSEAMVRLSEMYRMGLGVTARPDLAEDLLIRAAAAGNSQARILLESQSLSLPSATGQPAG